MESDRQKAAAERRKRLSRLLTYDPLDFALGHYRATYGVAPDRDAALRVFRGEDDLETLPEALQVFVFAFLNEAEPEILLDLVAADQSTVAILYRLAHDCLPEDHPNVDYLGEMVPDAHREARQ